ncbi:MAG TPA: DUF2089 family protein [Chthonomonadaceae bacterium]|nr:DUF2089 family protein [Chthonomonadaceae bacterium]
MAEDSPLRNLLRELDETDLEFMLRFVLTSGSLKEMARVYGVSYPTLRARLDRLIERLQALLQKRPLDPMALLLGDLVERGEVSGSTARTIQELHRKLIQARKES